MIRSIYLSILVILTIVQPLYAQTNPGKWAKWEYLLGDWKGEGAGNPGMGSGSFSFRKELSENVLVRKSITEFPAMENRPAFSHEDLMVVHTDFSGFPSKATYFDNEGHTIHYDIDYSGDQIILTSESIPSIPRFRLIYKKIDEKTVNIAFAIASPDSPDQFKTYLEGRSIKTN
jgi:hypothetical protein